MKLSQKTTSILRNFAAINPSIVIRKGSVLKALSPSKAVFARAVVVEDFPVDVKLFDLPRFLALVGMMDDPELDVRETTIGVSSGRQRATYYMTDETSIRVHGADRSPKIPDDAVCRLTLTNADLQATMKALGVMQLPEVAIVGRDGKALLTVIDPRGASKNDYSIQVDETEAEFSAVVAAEKLRLLPEDYEAVVIRRKENEGLLHLTGASVEYLIALEVSSKFAPAQG